MKPIQRQTPPAPVEDFRARLERRSGRAAPDPLALCRRLVWLYFWLLVFEGALRKWVAPSLSAPLLVVRDPVVLAIYFQAVRRGVFPKGSLVEAFTMIAMFGGILALIQFAIGQAPLNILLYGWRTNFFFIPLIFVIPKVMDGRETLKMGKWIMIVSIPMALLMAYQFTSSPDAWINRVAGTAEGRQLESALGRIRPPGTFSFITGPVCFYSLASAFLCYGIAKKGTFAYPLLAASVMATGLAAAVSGSRSLVVGVVLVLAALVIGFVLSGQFAAGTVRFILMGILVVTALGSLDIFKEGRDVFLTRWTGAEEGESEQGGMIGRFFNELISPFSSLGAIPALGEGLGKGTNAGAALLTGQMGFLLSEGEWGRDLLEMGPFFGLVYIAYRLVLVIWMARVCAERAKSGNTLSMLLFAAVGLDLLSGQIAQPTTLGFTVFVAGLCLAGIDKEDAQSFFQSKRLQLGLGAKRKTGRKGALAYPGKTGASRPLPGASA